MATAATTATKYTDVETVFEADLPSSDGKPARIKVEVFRDPKSPRKKQPWGFRIAWGSEALWEYHRRYVLRAHAERTARRAVRNRRAHGQFIGRPEEPAKPAATP